ncbi:hypothetical protein [Zooshikella harenae]|uniref:Uncharacterized protein n=1 Tax=Zooshikella harenae TaxID=2827238 RepID=A0ABS5ZIU3_9GAMM|nr:hypothetical protein [Zooshikella harenae]MBU2713996.1 hypothetical protein [Zooshikella harenae]
MTLITNKDAGEISVNEFDKKNTPAEKLGYDKKVELAQDAIIKNGGSFKENQEAKNIDEVCQESEANKKVEIVELLFDPAEDVVYLLTKDQCAVVYNEFQFLEDTINKIYQAGTNK